MALKCSFCEMELKKGDFIATIGNVRGSFFGGIKTAAGGDPFPMMEKPKLYCKSCFNKQFKK